MFRISHSKSTLASGQELISYMWQTDKYLNVVNTVKIPNTKTNSRIYGTLTNRGNRKYITKVKNANVSGSCQRYILYTFL